MNTITLSCFPCTESWPEELREEFWKAFESWRAKQDGRFDYPDRFRVARISVAAEVSDYTRERESGCCGSFDDTWEILGEKILIGFNYGH